jgi:hypothetical protein
VDGLTLVDALRSLNETAGKPVALLIDQAQHALISEAGEAAMTALKSARDQLNPLAMMRGRFETALHEAAQQQQIQDEGQMAFEYLGLKPIEQAVLWRMLEQGPRYRPDDAEALRFYRDKTGHPVGATQAQRALESLRQRMPARIWKSAEANTRWKTPPCTAGMKHVWRPALGHLQRHKACCLKMRHKPGLDQP